MKWFWLQLDPVEEEQAAGEEEEDVDAAGEEEEDGDEDYIPEAEDDDEEEEGEEEAGTQPLTKKKRKPRQPNITFDERVEAELIDWYRDHPEFYNSKLKSHKDTERKEALMTEKAKEVGLESK